VELTRHLDREPSYAERILIARLVSNEWDLRRLDARLDAGEELSGHAARLRLALENRLRLDLQAIGLAPKPQPERTLAEILANIEAGKQRQGAK